MIDERRLDQYRTATFRLERSRRLKNREEALVFVRERGFIYFWPIKGVLFPSLWAAVAGNRPVADKHDDPGHVTWGWKDEMLGTRQWYYAKLLRGKATLIDLALVPTFYALSENYGEPEQDYLQRYADGLLSQPAKLIYEAILREGALDTVHLRQVTQMTRRSSDSAFARGMTELQRDFRILPVGVARTGGWRYSFIYEAVHRFYPELPGQARVIGRGEARVKLARTYFDAVGAATEGALRKLFQWAPHDTKKTLATLVAAGHLALFPGSTAGQTLYTLPQLLEEQARPQD